MAITPIETTTFRDSEYQNADVNTRFRINLNWTTKDIDALKIGVKPVIT
jgi:hypothetical protein